jgi:hypothetical protein
MWMVKTDFETEKKKIANYHVVIKLKLSAILKLLTEKCF